MKKIPPIVADFFDFYSINELYMRSGGFRDIGYEDYSVFVSGRIEEKIHETCEEIVNDFFEKVKSALIKSIKSELRHFPKRALRDSLYTPYQRLEKRSGIKLNMIRKAKKDPFAYANEVYEIFTQVRWVYAYGGAAWGRAAKQLENSKNVKTLQDKIYWIDCVLDLQHNTGHLLNKTVFKHLSTFKLKTRSADTNRIVYRCPLTFRAKAISILDFIPYNSSKVKRLVIARKRILT